MAYYCQHLLMALETRCENLSSSKNRQVKWFQSAQPCPQLSEKTKCLFKGRLSNQSEREQHRVCVAQSLAERKHTAFLQEISTLSISWAQAGIGYRTLQLSTYIATYYGEVQQRNEEGRKDTVSERVSHQHHEITCLEADCCFLVGESFDQASINTETRSQRSTSILAEAACALKKHLI